MRRASLATVATIALFSLPALAQPAPPPAAPQAATPQAATPQAAAPEAAAPAPGTVIAKVGSDEIHYSDLQDAMQTLPDQLRAMPPAMLYPMLLDQLIDRDVIVQ